MKNATIFATTTLLFSLWCAPANAQRKDTSLTNELTIQFGAGHLSRQDLILSPFVMQDFSPLNVLLEYRQEKKVLQKINLSLGMYHPVFRHTYSYYWPDHPAAEHTYPHNFILVQASYGMAKALRGRGSGKWQRTTYLGAMLLNNVDATFYNFGPFSTFGYFASFGLGPWWTTQWRLSDKSTVNLEVAVPLLAWIARSPYLANDDEYMWNTYSHNGLVTFFEYVADGRLQTLNRFQHVSWAAHYRRALGRHWKLGVNYRFSFLHYAKPLPLWSYTHLPALSATYEFQ